MRLFILCAFHKILTILFFIIKVIELIEFKIYVRCTFVTFQLIKTKVFAFLKFKNAIMKEF